MDQTPIKRGRGRPKLPDKRRNIVRANVTNAELEAIERVAGGRVTAWARRVLLAACGYVKESKQCDAQSRSPLSGC